MAEPRAASRRNPFGARVRRDLGIGAYAGRAMPERVTGLVRPAAGERHRARCASDDADRATGRARRAGMAAARTNRPSACGAFD
ncbi:hypothetical protein A8H35_16780 [Burkholderia thailandensis]|uniref:Uncharacterized protein n=1 Tax=Burkholderia thailandensis (strain ATCC 700388 / DSM 13276 / CCUG 48851 / CIP 106301 / E264) TaxID=271848 RepID=Q2SVP0_BURTA|nr:hypothetical protein BTH_I2488 [Burkholderia thailandensis E264]AOJ45160.1 hypothetical protein WJ27_08650 [Burkholderia thailandensis]AVR10612.1 hypothetical protein A8H31_25730 [Burkholderia thailandensis]AWY59778.1 hypothetical protein A8H35_16780 [Burkholderia thailandensis]AWY69111.1 hypothetical protein A8H36_30480 [Burkholderia thailandensis]